MQSFSIDDLRQQLREKFPQAHGLRPEVPVSGEPVSLLAPGAFSIGAISEVVSSGPVSGLGLLVAGLLGEPGQGSSHPDLVLIDGSDSFDPDSFAAAACSRLLWVRCKAASEMLKAADLLARDGNVPFLLLDTTGLPRKDMQAFPASAWWRLKQTIEGNGGRMVVFTSFPIVPCAKQRWLLSADLSLGDFDRPQQELLDRLSVVPERLHRVN